MGQKQKKKMTSLEDFMKNPGKYTTSPEPLNTAQGNDPIITPHEKLLAVTGGLKSFLQNKDLVCTGQFDFKNSLCTCELVGRIEGATTQTELDGIAFDLEKMFRMRGQECYQRGGACTCAMVRLLRGQESANSKQHQPDLYK
jgi:hypothetical protein